MSGESEKTLRDTFDEAKVRRPALLARIVLMFHHQRVAPCLLFIDEIDAITPKRESAQREMERRIVAQFLTCMDGTVTGYKSADGAEFFCFRQICLGTKPITNL